MRKHGKFFVELLINFLLQLPKQILTQDILLFREAIKEDEDGLVEGLVAEFAQKAARKAAAPRRGPIRLGMMRHLLVAIDCSEAMTSQDLKPMRFLCTLKVSCFAYTSVVLYVLPPLSQSITHT